MRFVIIQLYLMGDNTLLRKQTQYNKMMQV